VKKNEILEQNATTKITVAQLQVQQLHTHTYTHTKQYVIIACSVSEGRKSIDIMSNNKSHTETMSESAKISQ